MRHESRVYLSSNFNYKIARARFVVKLSFGIGSPSSDPSDNFNETTRGIKILLEPSVGIFVRGDTSDRSSPTTCHC